ncbi:MAG: hypothetical protein HRT87_04470 [Legionellales bacterium]|nr:hypothetical protein [Legionellales bacterium]
MFLRNLFILVLFIVHSSYSGMLIDSIKEGEHLDAFTIKVKSARKQNDQSEIDKALRNCAHNGFNSRIPILIQDGSGNINATANEKSFDTAITYAIKRAIRTSNVSTLRIIINSSNQQIITNLPNEKYFVNLIKQCKDNVIKREIFQMLSPYLSDNQRSKFGNKNAAMEFAFRNHCIKIIKVATTHYGDKATAKKATIHSMEQSSLNDSTFKLPKNYKEIIQEI